MTDFEAAHRDQIRLTSMAMRIHTEAHHASLAPRDMSTPGELKVLNWLAAERLHEEG